MQELQAAQLLDVSERGAGRTNAELALDMLDAAGWPRPRGAAGLGERDAWLLELRRRTFGDRLRGLVACPACREELELNASVDDLHFERPAEPVRGSRELTVSCEGVQIRARTCDASDLEAACAAPDVAGARAVLLSRCVLEVRDAEGRALPAGELDAGAVRRVGEAIADADPQSEIRLQLCCAHCGHAWEALLDVAQFTWREVLAAGGRLVDDIHTLAAAYGWTEGEVLGLSARRRRTYVDRALGG